MTPDEAALASVVQLFRQLQVPYMLTGSIASSYHGRPRATHDADIVIDPTAEQMERLVESLVDAGFYVDANRAREALRSRGQFNVIHMTTASKVDLIVRKDRPFSYEEFVRRRPADLPFGRDVDAVTAEDAIVSKLEWARRSGDSPKQLADAAGVLAVTPGVDRAYIERWARELGVADLWRAIAEPSADRQPYR